MKHISGVFQTIKKYLKKIQMQIGEVIFQTQLVYFRYLKDSQVYIFDSITQRPKNAGGRVALPPGRFGSIRKIYGHGLLKTSLKNRFKICPDSSRCFRTAQIMSGQPKMCPDRLIFCPDSSKYIRTD